MKEKERYEMNDNDCLVDNEQNTAICDFCELTLFPEIVINLLNYQDKKIKELSACLKRLYSFAQHTRKKTLFKLVRENEQLIKAQKQLAISEIEKTKKCCEKFADELYDNLADTVLPTDIDKPKREAIKFLYLVSEFIDNQIKELKGEMREKK